MRLTAILLVAALSPQAAQLPPIPPLLEGEWPRAETAEPFARAVMARMQPAQLDDFLTANRDQLAPVLRNFGTALVSRDAKLREAAAAYAAAMARAHARRIPKAFTGQDVQLLVTLQVVDPLRYGDDAEFRRTIDTILPRTVSPTLPRALARADLSELNRAAPVAFATSEAIAAAAGLIDRTSGERYVDFAAARPRVAASGLEPIRASIFSLNSQYVTPAEARRLLAALRAAAPKRRLVVLGDEAMRSGLGAGIARLGIEFVDSFSRPFTIWPRDPFFVARAADGGTVLVNRPNLQAGREEDANMARALAGALPQLRWTTGTTAFHNGQILLTAGAVWISIHSVEQRAREILGLDHVPVETFGSAEEIDRYLGAVRRAADELARLYGRPVRFVHRLAPEPALMKILGGGAGFDLDSILTLLPRQDGSVEALVADIGAGARLAKEAPRAEWEALQRTYGFQDRQLVENPMLQAFLDRCAKDLEAAHVKVQRLPLLIAPGERGPFLVGWNNVRLEEGRAEGFASGLPAGDRLARAVYARAGYQLQLFPSLTRSVILNGGYRCASNEVR